MHALNLVGQFTRDPIYIRWAAELAQTAHKTFTYITSGGRKGMYWKMSIDLSHPLVSSMGQHDPLDGFITYHEIHAASGNSGEPIPDLKTEITDMDEICQGMSWVTDDPLGIGGLLFDASRIIQLMIITDAPFENLLENVLDSALIGLDSFAKSGLLELSGEYRLAFRELGLSIGLEGLKKLRLLINTNVGLFKHYDFLKTRVELLLDYLPLATSIEQFWMDNQNRKLSTWINHQEINMVMLATSIAPDGFLRIFTDLNSN